MERMEKQRKINMERQQTQFFLVDFSAPSPDIYSITIYNSAKKTRYVMQIIKQNIFCQCSDFKYRCEKNRIQCKHLLFLTKSILKLPVSMLSIQAEQNTINQRIAQIAVFDQRDFNKAFKQIDQHKLEEQQDCPICFEELGQASPKTDLVSCPTCKNILHEECMHIWIKQGKANCVFCRSEAWKLLI